MLINYYKTVRETVPTTQLDIFTIYEIIRSNKELKTKTEYIQTQFKDVLQNGITQEEKKPYQSEKQNMLPVVVFSGCYDRAISAEEQNDVQHSGRMNVDIDLNSMPELDAFFNLIGDGDIPFIESAARSVSGIHTGAMWVNVLIYIPEKFSDIPEYLTGKLRLSETNYKSKIHTAYFDMFSDMLKQHAGIVAGSTKDVKRFRYLSHDSDIYVNKNAQPLTLQMLENHLKAQNKGYNKELNKEFSGMSDPFKIAMTFATNKVGACVPGNQHNFIVQLASCLNRMGISETECTAFVESKLGVTVDTNCISFPYRAYASSHGEWNDWQATSAPSQTHGEPPQPTESISYFKALGYNKDESGTNRYFFYAFMSNTIVAFVPAKMTKPNLLQLAPLNWWRAYFPKGESFNIEMVIDYLLGECTDVGYFSPLRLRGRGAWIDNGKVLIHTGLELIIESKRYKLGHIETEYIYEMADTLDLSPDRPMVAEKGVQFYDIIKKLNWTRKLDPILLMGWLGLFPICGALEWRPHVWIVGGAGSGKTWVNKNIVNKFVACCGHNLEGGTTEAGIRMLLGNDAVGISLDEAEGENTREQQNMDVILKLIRSMSASESALVKWSPNGARVSYPRAMVLLSSVNQQTEHGADKRRISLLRLGRPIPKDDFEPIDAELKELMTDDFIRSFQARMLSKIPLVLANIKIFSKVISKITGRSDMGDQLGSMIAAWWTLMSDDAISYNDAMSICSRIDFTTEQSMETMPDEMRCLYVILNAQLRTDSGAMRSISELIDIIINGTANDSIDDVEKLLVRHGIRVMPMEHVIYVSVYRESWIKNIMVNTNWTKDWRTPLERIKGAEYNKAKKFMGRNEAVVIIPISAFMSEDYVDNNLSDIPF